MKGLHNEEVIFFYLLMFLVCGAVIVNKYYNIESQVLIVYIILYPITHMISGVR